MALYKYELIVIGGSAGALKALATLLPIFPVNYPLPIAIVQHVHPLQDSYFVQHFAEQCALPVTEAAEKEPILAGHIYFAPPNYHLLIENDRTFSLSIDERVNYSRPSIDVLFTSAVDAYAPGIIGVILTGANNDGAYGMRLIKEKGGLTIVQDPTTAESSYMPKAALVATKVDHILPLREIGELLLEIPHKQASN
jgi:two-component system, chemotaxis family, protein-glutamate methylesterase/glutaminase